MREKSNGKLGIHSWFSYPKSGENCNINFISKYSAIHSRLFGKSMASIEHTDNQLGGHSLCSPFTVLLLPKLVWLLCLFIYYSNSFRRIVEGWACTVHSLDDSVNNTQRSHCRLRNKQQKRPREYADMYLFIHFLSGVFGVPITTRCHSFIVPWTTFPNLCASN